MLVLVLVACFLKDVCNVNDGFSRYEIVLEVMGVAVANSGEF